MLYLSQFIKYDEILLHYLPLHIGKGEIIQLTKGDNLYVLYPSHTVYQI